jgi:inhibitor of cysteine peptidase
MKSKLIMAGLTAVMALSLLACSPASTEVFIEIPIDDFMNQKHISGQVEVTAGESFTVTLGSNPTTGFQWSEEAQISDTGVLKQTGHEFIPPEEAIPGAGGKEKWTFEALKAGTATVSMEYSRPWEGGEKGEWTYNLTVTVK